MDLLDQVFMIFLLCVCKDSSAFFKRWESTNGPFLTDRGKTLLLLFKAADDKVKANIHYLLFTISLSLAFLTLVLNPLVGTPQGVTG